MAYLREQVCPDLAEGDVRAGERFSRAAWPLRLPVTATPEVYPGWGVKTITIG